MTGWKKLDDLEDLNDGAQPDEIRLLTPTSQVSRRRLLDQELEDLCVNVMMPLSPFTCFLFICIFLLLSLLLNSVDTHQFVLEHLNAPGDL